MKKFTSIIISTVLVALTLCSCGKNTPTAKKQGDFEELKIGVNVGSDPQHDVFDNMTSRLEERGYKLVYVEYGTAKEANDALAKGKIDFSCISSKAEFDEYDKKNPDTLLNLGGAYYYPYGIYLCDYEKEADVADGAKILIPSDKEGMARALLLLEAEGYITLKEGAGLDATLDDIAENEHVFDIKAQAADTLAENIKTHKVGLVVMASQDAVNAGYSVHKTACAIEGKDSAAAIQYSTVLLIKADTLTKEKISSVQTLFFSPLMYDLIDDFPSDLIVPSFNVSGK